jgi:molecular chaperone DnaJ
VPRRAKSEPADIETPANGAEPPPPPPDPAQDSNATLLPVPVAEANGGLAVPAPAAPRLPEDPGLYAILGLDPSVSDVEIQTTYRRQAARLLSDGGDLALLRQLNVAYEVLGNPVRRAEYDRARSLRLLAPGPPAPRLPSTKGGAAITRRRRPRHVVQPRYAGLGDVFVVLVVVFLAIAAGALIIPRVNIDLSALNALSNVLPGTSNSRLRVAAGSTVTPATVPTRAPTPTIRPGLADRFAGSTVNVSAATPAQNTPESIIIRLRRDGQPASGLDVWATLDYRTTAERWPATGSVKTDSNGATTITFNVGQATPGYPVQVHVFAQVDDQQLSWSTSFTPR